MDDAGNDPIDEASTLPIIATYLVRVTLRGNEKAKPLSIKAIEFWAQDGIATGAADIEGSVVEVSARAERTDI